MSNPFGGGSSVVNGGGTATGGPIVQTIAGQPLAPGVVTRPGTVGAAPTSPKPIVETNTPAPVAPTPPTVTPPAVMPSQESNAVKKAGDTAVQAINARAGRASSILTDRRVSTLLTSKANAKAARPVFSPWLRPL
jgi:hypothetical protein